MYACTGVLIALTVLYLQCLGLDAKDVAGNAFDALAKSRNLLLVEHYSPLCGHCKAFAPTWENLTLSRSDLVEEGTEIVQVNCITDQELCKEHNIRVYPSIQLWDHGQLVEQYLGSRSLEALQEYVDKKHAAHQKGHLKEPLLAAVTPTSQDLQVQNNQDHAVLALNDHTFNKAVQATFNNSDPASTYFVKFFAPWCPHCKNLAPIWEDLAKEPVAYRSLNVAEVDCTIYKTLCTREEILGYPTLKLYRNGTKEVYSGPRTLTGLKEYIQKVADVGLPRISLDQILKIEEQKDTFFIYFHQEGDQSYQDLARYTSSLVGHSTLYRSDDHLIMPRFEIREDDLPALVAMRDYPALRANRVARLPKPSILDSKSLSNPELVKLFLTKNRYPTLLEIDTENWNQAIINNPADPIVLLAILYPDRTNGQAFEAAKEHLYQAAIQWQLDLQSTESRPFAEAIPAKGSHPLQVKREVIWAYVDGTLWQKWLKRNFKIRNDQEALTIIMDTKYSRYSDHDKPGSRISVSPETIRGALYEYDEGLLETHSTKGVLMKIMSIFGLIYDFWVVITVILIIGIMALYLILNRHQLLSSKSRRRLTGYEKTRGLLD